MSSAPLRARFLQLVKEHLARRVSELMPRTAQARRSTPKAQKIIFWSLARTVSSWSGWKPTEPMSGYFGCFFPVIPLSSTNFEPLSFGAG